MGTVKYVLDTVALAGYPEGNVYFNTTKNQKNAHLSLHNLRK